MGSQFGQHWVSISLKMPYCLVFYLESLGSDCLGFEIYFFKYRNTYSFNMKIHFTAEIGNMLYSRHTNKTIQS